MAGVATMKDKLGAVTTPLSRLRNIGGDSGFGVSMRQGLFYGLIVLLLLVAWMFLRSGETARRLQSVVPVKTAMIEVPEVDETKDPNAPDAALSNTKNIHALPSAPIEGLTESKDGKTLPITRIADDLTPFDAYKKPFHMVAGRPIVSFVIVDYGLSDTISQSMLENLPPDVTFVLTPYSEAPTKWAAASRAYGHEFWMYLPMQPQNFSENDSGPGTLLLNASNEQNLSRLFDVMSLVTGYTGIVSGQDHAFTADNIDAGPIMKQIFGRGLAFAESNPGVKAYGLSTAMEFGYPYVQNNLWLDARLRPEAVDRAIQAMERQASQKGKVVVFMHPYPVVVNKVQEWIKGAADKGFQVAPLSATVQ